MRPILAALVLLVAGVSGVLADESRLVVEGGVTYRETRRVAKVPVSNLQWSEQMQTVYRTEAITQLRDETRTNWIPTTQYYYEPKWPSAWNPLAKSAPTYQLRATTRWEARPETTRVPITVQQVIPETRIVQVPQRMLGFVDREWVERVAVGSAPQAPGNPSSPVMALQPTAPGVAGQSRLSPIPPGAPGGIGGAPHRRY